jgi:hypothetical protein
MRFRGATLSIGFTESHSAEKENNSHENWPGLCVTFCFLYRPLCERPDRGIRDQELYSDLGRQLRHRKLYPLSKKQFLGDQDDFTCARSRCRRWGHESARSAGDKAFLYVGDENHPIEAIFGGGMSIGSYMVGSAVFIQDKTGHVGISTTNPQYALDVFGNANVSGTLTKGAGSFKIDHPVDPLNKYLYHSFVESPDMMNIYNGNVITDKHGLETVILPQYFSALNRDFRYQLTVVGQFAQAIIARKVADNRFVIRTDKPLVEVSWQVTGIRQDAYANAHRIPVEVDKPQQEQGHYLHPELFEAK